VFVNNRGLLPYRPAPAPLDERVQVGGKQVVTASSSEPHGSKPASEDIFAEGPVAPTDLLAGLSEGKKVWISLHRVEELEKSKPNENFFT
jgi:hypothetical protein